MIIPQEIEVRCLSDGWNNVVGLDDKLRTFNRDRPRSTRIIRFCQACPNALDRAYFAIIV